MDIDGTLFDIAVNVMRYLLARAISEPVKRQAVIDRAREMVAQVGKMLAALGDEAAAG